MLNLILERNIAFYVWPKVVFTSWNFIHHVICISHPLIIFYDAAKIGGDKVYILQTASILHRV